MIQILEVDRLNACRKWRGIIVIGTQEFIAEASDAEFVSRFKQPITGDLIKRFAARNNDATARTGGYSIIRRFKGSAYVRAPEIEKLLAWGGGSGLAISIFEIARSEHFISLNRTTSS
jgi:hypothetical protein